MKKVAAPTPPHLAVNSSKLSSAWSSDFLLTLVLKLPLHVAVADGPAKTDCGGVVLLASCDDRDRQEG